MQPCSRVKYYQTAIVKFLGNSLISRIQDSDISTNEGLRRALRRDSSVGSGQWVDISGLIAPASEIERICDDVISGVIADVNVLSDRFLDIFNHYYSYEWTWAYDAIERYWKIDLSKITRSEAAEIVKQWKNAVVSLDKLIYDDASKEFALTSMTSFGADGDKTRRDEDFNAVRGGGFDDNPFVQEVLDHIRRKSALGDSIIARLR